MLIAMDTYYIDVCTIMILDDSLVHFHLPIKRTAILTEYPEVEQNIDENGVKDCYKFTFNYN